MAKKSKKVSGLNGIILILYGLAMFGMGFLPAYTFVAKNFITNSVTRQPTSFYQILSDLFENGFKAESIDVWTQIGTMLYFIVAILAVVLGLLLFLKVLKGKGLELLVYIFGLAVTIMILIIVFVRSGDYAALSIENISKLYVGTWVYLPLSISVIANCYSLYKIANK